MTFQSWFNVHSIKALNQAMRHTAKFSLTVLALALPFPEPSTIDTCMQHNTTTQPWQPSHRGEAMNTHSKNTEGIPGRYVGGSNLDSFTDTLSQPPSPSFELTFPLRKED